MNFDSFLNNGIDDYIYNYQSNNQQPINDNNNLNNNNDINQSQQIDINALFQQYDSNNDGYITFEEIFNSITFFQFPHDFLMFLQNILLIMDNQDIYQLSQFQYHQFFEVIQQILTIRQQYQNNNQTDFPETEKLRIYFEIFPKQEDGLVTTEQIIHWIRKMNDIQTRIHMETNLRGMNSNRCDETMFVNCFLTPDSYIREYCPKYINLFNKIDLNKNGKIDIQEIMYHISELFQYPENMRDFFTTVIKLLDSDGDNKFNQI